MASMRNQKSIIRSKVVKLLPGQPKPSKIQIFKKKTVKNGIKKTSTKSKIIDKRNKRTIEDMENNKTEETKEERKDIDLIRKKSDISIPHLNKPTILPEIGNKSKQKGGMLSGFSLGRTKTPKNKLKFI